MIKIDHITNNEEHIDIISKWLWEEWGTANNFEFFKSIVKNSLNKKNLPQTFIALDNNKPIGTIGLWRCDMVSRQDLYPWLSALYVIPSYRNRGIGKQLQAYLEIYAKQLGYKELFLYTDLENYYDKSGWIYLDTGITYSGEYDKIYKKKLTSL
jgi:predicted N-acetyltransferase YhbS